MRILPVVLAGGVSEELKPITGGKPKTLIHVVGKPLYKYMLDNLLQSFERVFVVCDVDLGDIAPAIQITQREPGIEGAILSLRDHIRGETHVLLAYGDVVVPSDAIRMVVERAIIEGVDGSIMVVPVPSTRGYGAVVSDVDGSVKEISEESVGGGLAFGGAALLPIRLLNILEREGNLISAINVLLGERKVTYALWHGDWADVNYPWDLLVVLELLLPKGGVHISSNAKVSPNAVVEGPVYVDEGTEIDHYAVIKGPVYIGREAFIGAHSLIRNYCSVEEGARVGAQTELTHTLVGPRSTIGRGSYLSYSIVGEGAVVEQNVVTMSLLTGKMEKFKYLQESGRRVYKLGAIIGAGVRVKAGTVTKPGQVVSSPSSSS